jgi:uncharacterized membrane protein
MNFFATLSDHAKAVLFYIGALFILALKILGLFVTGAWWLIGLFALAGVITDAEPTGTD